MLAFPPFMYRLTQGTHVNTVVKLLLSTWAKQGCWLTVASSGNYFLAYECLDSSSLILFRINVWIQSQTQVLSPPAR